MGNLGFSKDWFTLGILTKDDLNRLEQEFQLAEDKNPEHYRWRAFKEFLRTHGLPNQATLRALFKLGDNDPDYSMGGAMMARVLELAEYDSELVELALASGRSHLVKIALQKRQEHP